MSSQPPSVTVDQARRYRLLRGGLLTPFSSPEAAAGALFGVQAQIHPAAGLALWNRTDGLSHARFETLVFTDRSLVKLWGQRNTLHLYPSAEWPLVFGALSANPTWWGRTAEKDGRHAQYAALVDQVAGLLAERGILTRSDLRAAGFDLDDEHLSPWGGIFADLVRRGDACHAGRTANEGMFAARTYWLPDLPWEPPAVDQANAEALRRFLHTFGPATLQDFVYWRGPRGSNGRRWWSALADELVEVDVAGAPAFVLRADLDELLAPAAVDEWPVRLLYRFDPLLLAHKDRTWILPDQHRQQVIRPAGHIEGIVLVRGQAAAAWRYTRKAGGLQVTVAPFHRLPATVRRQVEHIAAAIAAFFALPLADVTFASR